MLSSCARHPPLRDSDPLPAALHPSKLPVDMELRNADQFVQRSLTIDEVLPARQPSCLRVAAIRENRLWLDAEVTKAEQGAPHLIRRRDENLRVFTPRA